METSCPGARQRARGDIAKVQQRCLIPFFSLLRPLSSSPFRCSLRRFSPVLLSSPISSVRPGAPGLLFDLETVTVYAAVPVPFAVKRKFRVYPAKLLLIFHLVRVHRRRRRGGLSRIHRSKKFLDPCDKSSYLIGKLFPAR